MGWTRINMTSDQARDERRQTVGRLVMLTNLRQQKLGETCARSAEAGVVVDTVVCDGIMLMAHWWYDGIGEPEFVHHSHPGAHETVGLISGYARFELDNGFSKELTRVGDSVYVPMGTGHRIIWKQGVPSDGWLIAVPPDESLLPRDSHGICKLMGTSKCVGSSDCALRILTGGGDGPGGR